MAEESEKMEIDRVSDMDKASDRTNDREDESSDEISDNDEEYEKQASELEKKVEQNPYDYNAYIELIKLLQKIAEIERLRKAREMMSRHFPLTTELWISWLQDEINIAASDAERSAIVELFERAVQDYLSVDLWLEYAQFSIGNMGLQDGVKTVRNTFERALTAAGLHAAKGAILWEAYREFENVMLTMLQSRADTDLSESQQQELAAQKNRLVTIFRRQMACPLLDMEKTYQEFTEWLNEEPSRRDGVDIKNIESGFKTALLKLSKILPYEEQLLSSDNASKADHYRAYLQYEMSKNDPARVQCLYERTVADLCLDASMWLEYIEYLDSVLKIDTVVLSVCKRAVRNCPWSSPLWQHYLRALERYKKPFDEVKDVMEQALSVGFSTAEDYRSLWLCYIEYMRRRVDWGTDHQSTQMEELRTTFNRACDHLAQYFGLEGDPGCDILQYWARIEAAYCKNPEEFRRLWSDILSQGHDKTAAMWLEYIQWERAFGDSKHLRRLFARALTSTQDWPESIGNAWLNFERDEGTLDSYEFFMTKYKSRMKEINDQRKRMAEEEEKTVEKGEKWKHDHKQERGLKQNPRVALKKKHETEGRWAAVAPKSVITKSSSRDATEAECNASKESTLCAPPPGYRKREKTADVFEEPPTKISKQEKMDTEHGVSVDHDSTKDNRTVFVSNLDYSVGEAAIREVFSSLGTITELRLVKDFKGRSKGFCYVEFGSPAEAEAALKKDREPVDGRPMFVSRCNADKHMRESGFKYNTTLEKNKLFVKGLPVTVTKEELEDVFKSYGSLKDVRIVTYRNGHSKGLAYVEYHDEAAAAHALIKTDGMTMGDRTVSVAISKPPERKNNPGVTARAASIMSLGGGARAFGARGRGRTQVSLLPRSLQVSHRTSTTPSSSTVPACSTVSSNGSNGNGTANGDGGTETQKPMSNSDFRQMLLGIKK
ncbi:Squamous cell carcinoma antigen recognized by T-cells 3 [Cryptotermes secundus]|uniref:Squamous cell carcinoma antigen recognized by T-cells 3 n=2 Tax=Cryptotermes secundus TaxID=105785 RepID=A0A2J7RMA1_9NEOP|nr:Squamous cell carcinoma antigen recognized by T-cells 3 [Cryptotermes secundus]